MGNSYTVTAVLSAQDKNFSSTLKSATRQTESFGAKLKSGLGFGILQGIGQQAFSSISSGFAGLIGEIDASNAAWKTFEDNMNAFGKGNDIKKVKKELQSFAEQTIYSSSDMASTYAQLEAVGVGSMKGLENGTLGVVKGFGGLAAAAENPQQAMKTLSQQATQMAGKPTVAWQDFKLMMEQTPAGIAAIAKEMGMTTSQLVAEVQDGTISTKQFFAAVEKVGTSDTFANMATQYKTAGQAMDGLKETLGNKLMPAFQILSKTAIGGIEKIIAKVGKIDGEAIAKKVSAGIEKAKPYWDAFVGVLATVGKALKKVGKFLLEHSDTIAKAIPYVLGLVGAFKAYKIINSVAPAMMKFAKGITSLAGKGISAIAGKLFGIAAGEKAAGTASQASAGQVMAAAKSFLVMSAAVLLISAGFALLAFSAIALANAGWPAIAVMGGLTVALVALGFGLVAVLKTLAPMGAQLMPVATAMVVMAAAVAVVAIGFAVLTASAIMLANSGGLAIGVLVGMVVAIALLAAGAYVLAPALTAGAAGFIAFGAAILLVGAGVLLASAGMALLATQLPVIATYGLSAAMAIVALGTGLMVFAAGALLAGAGALVLTAGIVAASVGVVAFGVAMTAAAVGILAMAAGLLAVASQMKTIAKNAKSAEKSLKSMRKSVKTVESGLEAIGSKAKSAMNKLKSAFDNTASKAKSAGKKVGTGFTTGMQTGLAKAASVAMQITTLAANAMMAGRSAAYSAGAYISKGFAQGMRSQLGIVQATATALAAAAEKAVRAKAKIKSPSVVFNSLGEYVGTGFANGIGSMEKDVWKASESLVQIPSVATPNLAMAYGGELSSDFDYHRSADFTITVVSEIDGREVARTTAPHMQSELNKRDKRESRKNGRV